MKKRLQLLMTFLLLAGTFFLSRQGAALQASHASAVIPSDNSMEENRDLPTVAIDPGHGAMDPGKIGTDGALEKDINLAICQYLKAELQASGITVCLTREDDSPLYQETDTNKKKADMRARIAKIQEAQPDIAVSIHQNSYPDPSVSGPQVFYYKSSSQGKTLADAIQKNFDYALEGRKNRAAKANEDYYLLLHTSCPIVISECGFLSNAEECAMLQEESYQKKIAHSVYLGIMEYFQLPVSS